MEPVHLTYNELLLYVVIGGVILGGLLGLIPLILGIKKKKRNYGVFGFFASIIGGAISPLVCVIAVAVFTWLILRKPAKVVVNENPSDINSSGAENK